MARLLCVCVWTIRRIRHRVCVGMCFWCICNACFPLAPHVVYIGTTHNVHKIGRTPILLIAKRYQLIYTFTFACTCICTSNLHACTRVFMHVCFCVYTCAFACTWVRVSGQYFKLRVWFYSWCDCMIRGWAYSSHDRSNRDQAWLYHRALTLDHTWLINLETMMRHIVQHGYALSADNYIRERCMCVCVWACACRVHVQSCTHAPKSTQIYPQRLTYFLDMLRLLSHAPFLHDFI